MTEQIITDLKETFEELRKSDDDGKCWYRELTAIENAIRFLEK